MKEAYPVIISKSNNDVHAYSVFIPDMDLNTEGDSLADAIYMARDIISLTAMTKQDMHQEVAKPNTVKADVKTGDVVTLVDVDIDEYRKRYDKRAVKKNCTIPYYLNEAAEAAGINFSKVLQEALSQKLGIN